MGGKASDDDDIVMNLDLSKIDKLIKQNDFPVLICVELNLKSIPGIISYQKYHITKQNTWYLFSTADYVPKYKVRSNKIFIHRQSLHFGTQRNDVHQVHKYSLP